MTRENEILNLLLDRYERSGHCMPGKESNRRVMISLKKGELANYRENDPGTAEINRAIEILLTDDLVSAPWRKGYEGWLYDKVILNLNNLEKAYTCASREPLSKTADVILRILQGVKQDIQSPWKLRFIEDECCRLKEKLHTSRLLPMNEKTVQAIMRVLQYTESGSELVRVISAGCFHDSKYLEQNILSQLTSIARAYEPELASYRSLGDEHLPQSNVLEQIGILTYPEIFEFCGSIGLVFPDGTVRTDMFRNGFCIQSENLKLLSELNTSNIKTLIFIENRTNYRHYILHGVPADSLIVFHGGFYSPAKRKLFSLIASGVTQDVDVYFWGDIDLGGFLMYTRLKREIFRNLIPFKMDREDHEKYKHYGVRRTMQYLDLLRGKMEDGTIDPCFHKVSHAILNEKVTVEQEIML